MARQGISSRALSRQGNPLGTAPFKFRVNCVSGTSTYKVFEKNCPFKLKVINVHGIMTGAGAASDTVKVTNGSSDITDTMDLSALSDKAVFDASTIDDAYSTISKGGKLYVTSASDATCELWIECVRIN